MPESNKKRTAGEIVSEARKNANLNLRDLASRIGIHFTYLADIEKNRVVPSEAVIKSISSQPELSLDFAELMSLFGRLGEDAEKLIRTSAQFGRLVRIIVQGNLSEEQLKSLTESTSKKIRRIKNSKEI